jgi:hypothetical protein
MKNLNNNEKAAIKRIARSLYNTTYKNIIKLEAKIAELSEELITQKEVMDKMDTTPFITNSEYKTFDLIERKETWVKDARGNDVKMVSFDFKYPDTIYPPIEKEVPKIEEKENTNTQDLEISEDIVNFVDKMEEEAATEEADIAESVVEENPVEAPSVEVNTRKYTKDEPTDNPFAL